MKKYYVALWVSLCGILILSACSTKERVLNQLEDFSIELRDNSSHYTIDEWKGAVDHFAKLRTKIEKYDYTPEERKRIGMLEGQCAGYMVKGAKSEVLNGVNSIRQEIEGLLQGVLGTIRNE